MTPGRCRRTNSVRIGETAAVTYPAVMSAFARAAGGAQGGRLRALLLIAVLAVGLLHVAQPIHRHDATSLGLYNEVHVLAALDSVTVDVPLPDAPPSVAIDPAPAPAPLAPRDAPASPAARSTQSRAPPLA